MASIIDYISAWMDAHRPALPGVWFAFSAIILWIDYLIGPYFQFPFLFLVPVLFAAWYNGRDWGLTFAVLLPLVRLYFTTTWVVPWTLLHSVLNAATRIGVLGVVVILAARVADQQHQLVNEVNTLEGLLPICSYCKKIKDENGNWNVMERYITDHSEAAFSHGICPDCLRDRYPDIAAKMETK